jgi:hypothetical protein
VSLDRIAGLHSFKMSENKLSGPLPDDIGSLPLVDLYLDGNKFTGSVPRTLDSSLSLQYLYLLDNKLSGTLPTELCSSPLVFFYASGNVNLTCYEPCLGLIEHEDFTGLMPECIFPTCKSYNASWCLVLSFVFFTILFLLLSSQLSPRQCRHHFPPVFLASCLRHQLRP